MQKTGEKLPASAQKRITVGDIEAWFDAQFPERFAMDWDNVGLLTGRRDREVTCVYLALDATMDTVVRAKEAGAQMILTHHPLIFRGMKRIEDHTPLGNLLLTLIESGIAVYSSHTSYDIAPGGMADEAVRTFGLFETEGLVPLECTGEEDGRKVGIGAVGALKKEMTVAELAQHVKTAFELPFVTVYAADRSQPVKRAAISPGSGKSMVSCAVSEQARVLITGDMGHHEGLDLMAEGISLIDAGHYGLEHIFIHAVGSLLKKAMPSLTIVEEPLHSPCEVIV